MKSGFSRSTEDKAGGLLAFRHAEPGDSEEQENEETNHAAKHAPPQHRVKSSVLCRGTEMAAGCPVKRSVT